MRRVAFRLVFESLDRRDNPGSAWGLFGFLNPISALLDHSHGKPKASIRATPRRVGVATTTPPSTNHFLTTHLPEPNARGTVEPAADPSQKIVNPHPVALRTVTPATTPRT